MPRILIFLLAFLSCSRPGQSQQGHDFVNTADIELEPLVAQLPGTIEPTLIGGEPAKPEEWPATVYSSQGNSRCTATVVGEKVLFIAAHCVGNGRTATFRVAGKRYSSTCTHSPKYNNNSTADWALCLVSEVVEGIKYEVLSQDAALVKVGDAILLTGYGCTQPGGSGGNDGVYRIGQSKILRLPSGSSNDIVTKGGAALCYGDSGGPAFALLHDGRRLQLSINSRGDIKETSYLSAVYTSDAKDFIASWSQSKNVKLCGVHEDAPNCRGGSAPESPLPAHCKEALDKLTACLYGKPRVAIAEPEKCREAHAALFACEEMAENPEFGSL